MPQWANRIQRALVNPPHKRKYATMASAPRIDSRNGIQSWMTTQNIVLASVSAAAIIVLLLSVPQEPGLGDPSPLPPIVREQGMQPVLLQHCHASD